MSEEDETGLSKENRSSQLSNLYTSDVLKLDRTIVSVEYPGQVINEEEAFRTMGGIQAMSAVHTKENRKYECFILYLDNQLTTEFSIDWN